MCSWHCGFGIFALEPIPPGHLKEIRGFDCPVPVDRVKEMMGGTHRWSVGSLKPGSSRIFYLGGPLSLLNAACSDHAICNYHFGPEDDQYAVSIKSVDAGEELTCCYSGGDDRGPLLGSGKLAICVHSNCSAYVMTL